jgi:hypothetical protein
MFQEHLSNTKMQVLEMNHVSKDVIPFSIKDTYMDESTKGDANLKCSPTWK